MNISGTSMNISGYYRAPQVKANNAQLSFGSLVRVEDAKRTEMLQNIDKKVKAGEKLTENERSYLIRYMPDVYKVIFGNRN